MFDFLPVFDSSAIEHLERNAQRAADYRRLSFRVLTKSSDELRAVFVKPEMAEKFLYEVECLREAIEQLEVQIELMRAAEARILAALSDMFPEEVEQPANNSPRRRIARAWMRTAILNKYLSPDFLA